MSDHSGRIVQTGGVAATDFDTSLELKTILTDETGSGAAVFGTSPTFTTSTTLDGTATFSSPTAIKTSAYPVVSADGNKIFTNSGAGGQVIFTLPAAAANLGPFTFVVSTAQNVQVLAVGDDTIRLAATASAAAGHIDNATIGGSVTLIAIDGIQWFATALMGTWTVT